MTDDGHRPLARATQLAASFDRYEARGSEIVHRFAVGNLSLEATISDSPASSDAKGAWWHAYLAGNTPRAVEPMEGRLRTVDLFCGPGGLANGVAHLGAELGLAVVTELIVDQDAEATLVYAANHPTRRRSTASVATLVDFSVARTSAGARFAYHPDLLDAEMANSLQGTHLVLAGPPCQGHSNLNNQTRRRDPRNGLYLTVPAFAVAIGAPVCVIENVPAILNDVDRIVDKARQLFESAGYEVTSGMLSAGAMGWPQTRKRHFLVARRDRTPIPLEDIADLVRDDARPLRWAIGHLEDAVGDDVMHQVTELSEENQARIDWLFDNDEHDLALSERPKSHRKGTTYTAVYGRLGFDEPAPTITTGFMTPGRGRFTHPTRRRVLTAHEAARLQGFPDTYTFVPDPVNPPSRAKLAKWIGDAVPMPLGYAAALSALGPGLPNA